ncbi:hypothetical protein TNCV_5133701 [Trichonephila clavipes]|nr:hypothetical protein TNCV_5133701 [Trichonephila clavipes]
MHRLLIPNDENRKQKWDQKLANHNLTLRFLSNISHNQEGEIEISSSSVNRDASEVVKQAFSSFDPGLCTIPMADAHRS